MKKFLLILILLSQSFAFVKAQDDNPDTKQDRIQALKIAFITQKLQLTSEEAQRFWPVYNNYENDIKQVIITNRSSDAIDSEEKALNIKKRYRSEFVKVIGQPKMNTLFNAEKEFRGVLMRHLKNRQFQQRPLKVRRQ
jgi:hypothetical protein